MSAGVGNAFDQRLAPSGAVQQHFGHPSYHAPQREVFDHQGKHTQAGGQQPDHRLSYWGIVLHQGKELSFWKQPDGARFQRRNAGGVGTAVEERNVVEGSPRAQDAQHLLPAVRRHLEDLDPSANHKREPLAYTAFEENLCIMQHLLWFD
jgi:hypothetical protein